MRFKSMFVTCTTLTRQLFSLSSFCTTWLHTHTNHTRTLTRHSRMASRVVVSIHCKHATVLHDVVSSQLLGKVLGESTPTRPYINECAHGAFAEKKGVTKESSGWVNTAISDWTIMRVVSESLEELCSLELLSCSHNDGLLSHIKQSVHFKKRSV